MELVGLVGTATLIVGPSDLALALGSGDVEVLGTPRLVALCEEATVAATAGHLEVGLTSVGTRVEIDHLSPNRAGDEVVATARVVEVDRRRVTFEVEATSGGGVVGRGVVTRVVVDRDRFA